MVNSDSAHELILQVLRTRMIVRQTVQRILRNNKMDMTFEMLQVMHRLGEKPGVSQQYLADETVKDKASLTNLINNLEKKGWVERKEDPNDRRNKQISLTQEGEALSTRVTPLLHEVYDSVEEKLSAKEMESCIRYLRKLDMTLEKIHVNV